MRNQLKVVNDQINCSEVKILSLNKFKNTMKRKFNLVLGLIFLFDLVYKIVKCPNCEDNILFFQVPGFVKILFLAILTIGLLYPVYTENWVNKPKE